MHGIVKMLRDLAACKHSDVSVAEEAADEIERLRDALRPFSRIFLWPDDLGQDMAAHIRADEEFDQSLNDKAAEDVFVLRGDIRKAREALKE